MESQQGPSQVLFDSVTAHFSITIFFYQLFLHLTYPLCLPISFYWHGWMFLYSQGFAPRNLGNIIFSYVVAVAFYLTILCALFSRDGIGFQALFPIFLYVAHRLMIAFKYATLSPGEYRRLMRGHNIRRRSLDYSHLPTDEEIRVVDNYQKQLQLLTGWLPINDERITYELIAASLLCVADMSASFKIPDPLLTADNSLQFQRWKRFLERNNFPTSALKKQVVNDESFYELDLLTFCNCVMRENRHYLTNLQPVTVILSIINACIPYFFILHKYSSLCVYSKIYYVTSGILNFIFYWATSSFMLSALEDSARRYFCAEKLATFIRAIDIDPRFQLRFKSDEYYDLFHTQSCKLQSVMRKSNSFRLSVAEPILPISQQPTQQSTSPSDTRVSSFELVSPSSPTMNPLYPPVSEYKDESQSNSSSLPAIRIADYPENIIVWMYARKLLHNFGARIRFRLDTYCGLFLFFSFIDDHVLYCRWHHSPSTDTCLGGHLRLSPIWFKLFYLTS